ncbi:MAG TPA: TetR family transcriptional regulator [Phenylobacterium sp.]|nr:TetR family transcriptional regulator [Phenylobacterium sp.]
MARGGVGAEGRALYGRAMGELRDAARTRKKIMEAARDEFAARGFAGARIESIARRAGFAKQLLYHYFPSKEALFEATLESKFRQHRAAMGEGEGPGAAFVQRFRTALADPVWVRFLTWEAAEHQGADRIIAEEARRESVARQMAAVAERQARGELPADLPTDLLVLAIAALAVYPLAYGQITEMVAGRAPGDPEFQARWTAFLDDLARRIARP